jgi:hypothetical protein
VDSTEVLDLTGTVETLELVHKAIDALDLALRAVPRGHRARTPLDDAIIRLHDGRRELEHEPRTSAMLP